MIVCICNNISEQEIKTCLDENLSLEEVCLRLHIGEYCGRCLSWLNDQSSQNPIKINSD